MKHAPVLKVRKVAPVTVAELLRRLIELQKLRERVRLAEVAMKTRAETILPRHN
jgi:enoyl reductase-like protein